MKNINTFFTRLTPNFKKWEKPSGIDGKCGRNTQYLYEGIYGFGWEEWLLYDYHHENNQLDGYCYGFIQAFHGGKNGVIDHPKTVDIDQSFSFA